MFQVMDGDIKEEDHSHDTQDLEQDNLIAQQRLIETEGMPSSTLQSGHLDLQGEESSMQDTVVITQDGSNSGLVEDEEDDEDDEEQEVEEEEDEEEEPPSKRMYLEQVGQDGHTYLLTLQSSADGMQTTQVKFDSDLQGAVSPGTLAAAQVDNAMSFDAEKCDVTRAWFTSREDRTILQSKDHTWKQGMWSKEETELLQHNIDHYCKEHGIGDPAEIIFEMTKDERKDFYRTVAKGLNRPLFSVYRRVIRLYDNKNHVGKYTPEEIERLKELRVQHGNDWQAIGTALGRSASSIKDRCRLMKDNCNTGKWLPSEERRLTDAVYQLSCAIAGEMVTSGISWSAVAEKVGTRSEKQCRTKWLNYLNWKQAGGTEWTREDDINLVTKLYSVHVTDENMIDWTELARGWPSVRSPQWLRGKWWNLKRHVPDAHLLTFRDICEFLYKNHAQAVKVKPADEASPSHTTEYVQAALNIPRVSVMQTPGIITTVPVQVQTEGQVALPTADDEVPIPTSVGASFQTFEVLPASVHLTHASSPATFLITPAQTAIPFTTCTPNSAGQIIIQALQADGLHSAEDVAVQMSMSSQIIISAGTGPATTLASLSAAGLTGPIQLTRPLFQQNAHLQIDSLAAQAATLLSSATAEELLCSEMGTNKMREADSGISSQTDIMSQGMESEEDSERDSNSRLNQRSQETPSHLIMADPMLSSSNSPELLSSTATGNDQSHGTDDSLDTGEQGET